MVFLAMLLVIFVFFLLNYLVGSMEDSHALSPFECGILGQDTSRNIFSFYFFYLTILFLLFDIELCCVVPIVSLKVFEGPLLLVLILGSTLVELKDGVLCWILRE